MDVPGGIITLSNPPVDFVLTKEAYRHKVDWRRHQKNITFLQYDFPARPCRIRDCVNRFCCTPWAVFQGWRVAPNSIFCNGVVVDCYDADYDVIAINR